MPKSIPAQLKFALKKTRDMLAEKKDYAEARRQLVSIPSAENYPQFHAAMARIALLEGDSGLSLAHGEKALSLNPDDVRMLIRVGKMRLASNDIEGARQCANRALAVGTSEKNQTMVLATLFQQIEEPETSLRLLSSVEDKNPNDSRLHRMIASAHLRMNQLDEAEKGLRDCLRISPSNHAALVMLGEIEMNKENYDKTVQSLQSADNEQCPAKLQTRLILDLAEAFVMLARLAEAKNILARIEDTSSPRYNYLWGVIQLKEGTNELALKSMKAAAVALRNRRDNDGAVDPLSNLTGDILEDAECLQEEVGKALKRFQWSRGNQSEASDGPDIDEFI